MIIITGKGGVGKTTSAAWYVLNNGGHLLSIDPMHSLEDAFGVKLKKGKWNKVNNFYLKEAIPIGNIYSIKDKIQKRIYTEYEVIAGQEMDKEDLIIDTDSLEGLLRLLNFMKENKINKKYEILPVVVPEPIVLEKTERVLEELFKEGQRFPRIIVNYAKDNFNYSNWPVINRAEKILFYKQPFEPIGNLLYDLQNKADFKIKKINVISKNVPKAHNYFIVGKGGQGKSTIASALAIKLSKEKPVYISSADAVNSLPDIFNIDSLDKEPYEIIGNIHILKPDPYWDNVPSVAMMRSFLMLEKYANEDCYIIIDGPPSGNIIKNFSFLPESTFDKSIFRKPFDKIFSLTLEDIIFKFDMFQLNLRKKKNAVNFYKDRLDAYKKAIEILKGPDSQIITIMQPTITSYNETDKLIKKFYEYGFWKEWVVMNKYDSFPLTKELDLFENITYVPEVKGKNILEKIKEYL